MARIRGWVASPPKEADLGRAAGAAPPRRPLARPGSGAGRNGMFALKLSVALVWVVLFVTFVH